jgi:aryl-phospho-beta-D-glucosidase BglC (GH1 family)
MPSLRRTPIAHHGLFVLAAALCLATTAPAQETTPSTSTPAMNPTTNPVTTQATHTAAATTTLAFTRAARLAHGINLSNWYAQAPDYSAERLTTFIDAADFRLIRSLGFDCVRLSINPEPLLALPPATEPPPILDRDATLSPTATLPLRPEAMARLDKTVREINAAGLVVVLDIHPEEAWLRQAFTDEGIPNFLYFWRTFARHYAGTDPEMVYFEVLNEPHNVSAGRWAIEQERAVAVIRKEAPAHTIVVTGTEFGGIGGLLGLIPLADANLIYSFHDYDPMVFTHQGATWAGDEFKPLRGVPYPSTTENIEPAIAATHDPGGTNLLQHYGIEHWSRARMQQDISTVVDWQRRSQVPVWCGEFGVYRDFAPTADRARWIADMRQTLEAAHLGWAMWDYRASFGMVMKKDRSTTVDDSIVQALGLKPAAAPTN